MSHRLRHILASLLLSGLGATRPAAAQPSPSEAPWHGLDLAGMDASVKPGDDLYQAANGGWLASTSLPNDLPRGGNFAALSEQNLTLLRAIAEDAARDRHAQQQSPTRQVGDLYASGMVTRRIEREGIWPLSPELALIDHVHDRRSLQAAIARLHRESIIAAFRSEVQPHPQDET